MATDYEQLLTALRDPASYPHAAQAVEHLQTHISHVFLAGDYAYKLKKPVDFGFLDFGTPEKRAAACAAELHLNRRLAPEVYLGAAYLCRGPRGLHVALAACAPGTDSGEVLVRMRRLPQEGLLDRLARAGRLTEAHMVEIASQVARFHAQGHTPGIERYGGLDAISGPVQQNFAQLRPYAGRVFDGARLARVQQEAVSGMQRHAARFAARVRAGRIVDGHGDLHLRNMCLADGRVVIFDCIEFNPALRAGDALSDIAFLVMDLRHRQLPRLATRFLNEYLEASGDYAGMPLLDFYVAYRACVRAKVLALGLDSAAPAIQAALAQEAAAYLELADTTLTPRRGGILITCGVSGSGKTTLARQVAAAMDAVIVRSDAVRKHLAGVDLGTRGASDPALYTRAMTEQTYDALRAHGREIAASGYWVILDAVHGRRAERAAAGALAQELGIPFGILHCTAAPEELRRRVAIRGAAGNDLSDATVAVLEAQLRQFEPPDGTEGPRFAWHGSESPEPWLRALASG